MSNPLLDMLAVNVLKFNAGTKKIGRQFNDLIPAEQEAFMALCDYWQHNGFDAGVCDELLKKMATGKNKHPNDKELLEALQDFRRLCRDYYTRDSYIFVAFQKAMGEKNNFTPNEAPKPKQIPIPKPAPIPKPKPMPAPKPMPMPKPKPKSKNKNFSKRLIMTGIVIFVGVAIYFYMPVGVFISIGNFLKRETALEQTEAPAETATGAATAPTPSNQAGRVAANRASEPANQASQPPNQSQQPQPEENVQPSSTPAGISVSKWSVTGSGGVSAELVIEMVGGNAFRGYFIWNQSDQREVIEGLFYPNTRGIEMRSSVEIYIATLSADGKRLTNGRRREIPGTFEATLK